MPSWQYRYRRASSGWVYRGGNGRVMRGLVRWAWCMALVVVFPMAGRAQSRPDTSAVKVPPGEPFHAGKLLYKDDFQHGLGQWRLQLQHGGTVWARHGVLNIDVPAGATVWFRHELHGPVMISYDAKVISAGGPNDRVSDLNCFWMATDPKSPNNIFAHPRNGAFASYNNLLTYYVGIGGRGNKTTRFRRYIGNSKVRPLLPQNNLTGPENMIVPNQTQHLRLIAYGSLIQFYRNQRKLFNYVDPHPYTKGWFAIRTVKNHMQVTNLRIVRLVANH